MIELHYGDCYEVLKTIPDKSIDLVVTDPPYEVCVTQGGGTINNVMKMGEKLYDLHESNLDNGYNIDKICGELCRVMKNINIYIWCNKQQIPKYFNFFVNDRNCKFDILCWHKTNPLPAYKNKYLTDTEYCLYFRKNAYCDPSQTNENERFENAKTFYFAPLNQKDKGIWNHPTIKPLDFTEKLIKNSSKKGEIVLDPFMGSGTTGVACKELERDFIGIEINERFYHICESRINGTEIKKDYVQGELF